MSGAKFRGSRCTGKTTWRAPCVVGTRSADPGGLVYPKLTTPEMLPVPMLSAVVVPSSTP
jgi:hypothetical protein